MVRFLIDKYFFSEEAEISDFGYNFVQKHFLL